jgi:hypothetical protein
MPKLSLALVFAGMAVSAGQQPPAQSGVQPPAAGQLTAQRTGYPEPPDFPPSYEVHISPTGWMGPGTANLMIDNYWAARGCDRT